MRRVAHVTVLVVTLLAGSLGAQPGGSASPRARADWKRQESQRYIFFYEDQDSPPPEAITANEDYLGRLEKLLGIRHSKKIPFYKYRSNARKGEITGDSGNAHTNSGTIHSIFWQDRHEVVHVLMSRFGRPEPLLIEGIAVYLSGSWRGQGVHQAAREIMRKGELIPLSELMDPKRFRSRRSLITYPEAGSFVGYLLEKHGLDKFKQLYADPNPKSNPVDLRRRFRAIYGEESEAFRGAWMEFLKKPPTSRPATEEDEADRARSW